MNPDMKNIDEVVNRYLPSASEEQIEAGGAHVLRQLRLGSDHALSEPVFEPSMPVRSFWRRIAPAAVFAAVLLAISVIGVAIIWRQEWPAAVVESVDAGLYRVVEGRAQPLHVKEKIHIGETIHANGGSGGAISLSDGSRVEMRSESELSLEQASDGVRIDLKSGSVIVSAAMQRPGRHLYVQTKDVTVSVVGTVFLVNAEESGSRVAVIEGEVRVQQDGTETKLLPGQQLTVATYPAVPSPSIAEEIHWSGQAQSHMAMLQLRARAPSDLRFEVASVRRVDIPATDRGVPVFPPTGGIGTANPSRITYRGTWLHNLIAEAFEVRPDQISGPDWLKKERYDVVANIPEGATKEQFRVMLGNLLRDRFDMRFHMETEIRPAYALRVAQNGPKFKETAASTADDTVSSGSAFGPPDVQGFPSPPSNYKGMVSVPGNGEMLVTAQNVSMRDFARSIERSAGRPVVDETGLAGHYDFKIRYEWLPRLSADGGVASVPAPSISAAVEEQLGLRLDSATTAQPRLIIDFIERDPEEN
jgi:uncharacterized protein (TIGR03435 family)